MKKFYMVGNTHFDPVWLWTYDEGMSSIRATFRSALDRMKEDENFIYSFSSPAVFEWIKNVDKEMFEEIKLRVKEGRWDICEGWWLQPDCYSASGEGYVRQSLYGQKYLMDNFGVSAKCVFNVDSFGHSPQLPQILKKSGMDRYCFVRPERRWFNVANDLFIWRGIDGSEVFAYRAEDVFSRDLPKTFENFASRECDDMLIYGVTDHGGAPTKKDIKTINETPNASFSTVDRFFDEQVATVKVKGEILTGDYGVYSDLPENKRFNRISERAVTNAEKALVFAGKKDDRTDECYKDVLFNQFHDIIGGSCIKKSYVDARNLYGRVLQTAGEILNFTVQSVCKDIKTVGKNPNDTWNLIVWNFNGKEFDGYIESEVQWALEFEWYYKGVCLEDEQGKRYPCQIIEAKAVVPGFRSRFVCKIDVPAYGYKTYKVVKTGIDDEKATCTYPVIDNGKYVFEFDDKKGGIKRVTDKDGNVVTNKILNVAAFEDMGDTWAFNVFGYGKKLKAPKLTGITVLESGAMRTKIKERYKFGLSVIDLYYEFYNGEDFFNLEYRVNSNEKRVTFKLLSDVNNYSHEVAVPYGKIKRGKNSKDVPLGEWIEVDGVTYACNSAFAYNMHEKRLGITLFRNVVYGDMRIADIKDYDYDILSQGVNEGKVMVTLKGEADVVGFANPPHIVIESNHDGKLPSENSFASVNNAAVDFGVIKNKTEGDGIIVRLVETKGKPQTAEVEVLGVKFSAKFKPFEIKTVLIDGKTVKETDLLENVL